MGGWTGGLDNQAKRDEIESRAMNRYEIDSCVDRTGHLSPTPHRGGPDKVPGTGTCHVTRYTPTPSVAEWSVRSSRDVDGS